MNFTFDTHGYLSPNKIFEIDLHHFETFFVYNIQRRQLYDELVAFSLELNIDKIAFKNVDRWQFYHAKRVT
jgi:hypothetical protein